jgi:Mn-dependent DtxR family transcriptional regulator
MEKIIIDRTKTLDLLSKLRMIANPIAHTIILILEEEGGLNVGTIQNKLKIQQAQTSGYLINMKSKGLLKS